MNDDTRQGRLAGAAMRSVYVAAGAAVGLVSLLRSALASGEEADKGRQRRGRWPNRRGRAPWVWIQAASVGEADLALALARSLGSRRGDLDFVVSSMTATGRARVLGDPSAESRYFPIDFAPFVKRIIEKDPPALFVTVETEIWPETLRLLAGHGVPLAVASARISDESLPGYRRARAFLAPVLAGVARVCARDEESARRWVAIGAREEAVEIAGNLKFDLALAGEATDNKPLFLADDAHPLVLAASTHEGEEPLAFGAFEAVRAGRPGLRLVVAPRHPERAGAVLGAAVAFGLKAVCWSPADGAGVPARWPEEADVVVLDRLGWLRCAYASAAAAFVGGSAVAGPGGHNLLEAVAQGCPVAAGPHLGNVADQTALLREASALEVVRDVNTLSKFWAECLASPEEAGRCVADARALLATRLGALDRTVTALLDLLGAGPEGRG